MKALQTRCPSPRQSSSHTQIYFYATIRARGDKPVEVTNRKEGDLLARQAYCPDSE